MSSNINPCLIRAAKPYQVSELAAVLTVSEKTLRKVLQRCPNAFTNTVPQLIVGRIAKAYLVNDKAQSRKRKRKLALHEFDCLSCKAARLPVPDLMEVNDQPGGKTVLMHSLCSSFGGVVSKLLSVKVLKKLELALRQSGSPSSTHLPDTLDGALKGQQGEGNS